MASREKIVKLLKKQLDNEPLTAAEHSVLQKWASKSALHRHVYDRWTQPDQIEETLQERISFNKCRSWDTIAERLTPKPRYRINSPTIGLVAASLILAVFVLFFHRIPAPMHTQLAKENGKPAGVPFSPALSSSILAAPANFEFQQASFSRTCEELGRWYNVQFVVAPSLQRWRISGQFFRTRTLPEILSILEAGGEFHSVRHGNIYLLIPNGPQ